MVKKTIIKVDNLPELKAIISEMKNTYTSVGVHEDATNGEGTSMAMIAAVPEFGAEIKNGFGRGIHIIIPERSYLRSWVNENRDKYNNLAKKLVLKIIDKQMSVIKALGLLGEFAVGGIKQKIIKGLLPPLKPATIARKGSSTPLIDTGALIGSITHIEKWGKRPKMSGGIK